LGVLPSFEESVATIPTRLIGDTLHSMTESQTLEAGRLKKNSNIALFVAETLYIICFHRVDGNH